ncbi:MAG: DUF1365 domain-containing protein [Nitriliruptoraceae bacterium]|nr:DUF1365 domain-containing protein [Nitriliruptoraceae bacterium]
MSAAVAVRSKLVVGEVRHRRHRPRRNAFRYRTYHALLDIDELPRLDRVIGGFGYGRRRPLGFADTDHFGPLALPVREKLRRWLEGQGVELPAGRVEVLTNLRVLGHVFDPVSWWFCHDEHDELALVVAEVHNTFGELHGYVLDELDHAPGGVARAAADKVFHVSPFLPIDGLRYRFTFARRGDRLTAHIDVDDAEGAVLDATQRGRMVELTTRRLWTTVARHPLMTLRTVALIHWQAVRLVVRRVRFHRKPVAPDDGTAALAGPMPSGPPRSTNRTEVTEEPRP